MHQNARKIEDNVLNLSTNVHEPQPWQNNYDWRQAKVTQYLEGCQPVEQLPPIPHWTGSYHGTPTYTPDDCFSSQGMSSLQPLTDSATSSFGSYSTQSGSNENGSHSGSPFEKGISFSGPEALSTSTLSRPIYSVSRSPSLEINGASQWQVQGSKQLERPMANHLELLKQNATSSQATRPLWLTADFQSTPSYSQQSWAMPAANAGQWPFAAPGLAAMAFRDRCEYCHKWISRPGQTYEPVTATMVHHERPNLSANWSLPQRTGLQLDTAMTASESNSHSRADSRSDRSTSQDTIFSNDSHVDANTALSRPIFNILPSQVTVDSDGHLGQRTAVEGSQSERRARNNNYRDNSEEKDYFLLQARLRGITYREIKATGRFHEAESTLRGRYRCLTKTKKQRVRQPHWTEKDLHLLKVGVETLTPKKLSKRKGQQDGRVVAKIASHRVPWKRVAEYIADEGGSYVFGSATCRRKWDETS